MKNTQKNETDRSDSEKKQFLSTGTDIKIMTGLSIALVMLIYLAEQLINQ